jgi:hypothetical protein
LFAIYCLWKGKEIDISASGREGLQINLCECRLDIVEPQFSWLDYVGGPTMDSNISFAAYGFSNNANSTSYIKCTQPGGDCLLAFWPWEKPRFLPSFFF